MMILDGHQFGFAVLRILCLYSDEGSEYFSTKILLNIVCLILINEH